MLPRWIGRQNEAVNGKISREGYVNRYSFVLIDRADFKSDFRFDAFPNLEKAYQLADVVASELSLDPITGWQA